MAIILKYEQEQESDFVKWWKKIVSPAADHYLDYDY